MLIKKSVDIKSSEITPYALYLNRREFIKAAGISASALALGTIPNRLVPLRPSRAETRLDNVVKSPLGAIGEKLTDYRDATTYNNFYEFGTGKDDPVKNAHTLKPRPWTVRISGEVDQPGDYEVDDLIKPHQLEERIYRLRCVEAWSMVIPWIGFPLGKLIDRFQPNSRARYVEFQTLLDVKQMPGQKRDVIPWPYVEGLRLDEARHPLTILAVGMYGEVLPNQNGAPIRLVVPWKYGFKSIKSIVEIKFTRKQPRNSWNVIAPHEYGFYANVNPDVDHPRWSQAKERRIGKFFKQDTLMFNGYADQVAAMYANLDLRTDF